MPSRIGKWFDDLPINVKIREYDSQNNHWFDKLDQFTETMSSKLDQRGWYAPVAYTPHDFSHHVKNVLVNASELIKGHLHTFSLDELFALQCACILHDIDMVFNPYQREIHNVNGAIILSPYNSKLITDKTKGLLDANYQQLLDLNSAGNIPNNDAKDMILEIHSVLSNVVNFLLEDDSMANAVSRIILGHSDIKLDNNYRVNTLDKSYYSGLDLPLGPQGTQMKIRILASVLRLADELDCSKLRIRHILMPVIPPEAVDYWEKLKIVSSVTIDGPQIRLSIDSNTFPQDTVRNFKLLKSVEDKIEQERITVQKCLVEESFSMLFAQVVIDWKNLDNAYEDEYIKYKAEQVEKEKKKRLNADHPFDIKELVRIISEAIEEKNLYREVHSRVSGKCIRNQLDCNGLLTRHQILDGVSQVFLNAIFTSEFDKSPVSFPDNEYALVGVANSGALIAAHMSYMSGLPMLYYVPPHKEKKFTEPERELISYSEMLENKKVALIIGVNHTGTAIEAAQKFIIDITNQQGRKANLHCVLGIVNRDKESPTVKALIENGINTQFLITGYPIEWCINEKFAIECPYGYKCKSGEEE